MRGYVAVTDKAWFEHLRMLSRRGRVDEVNFWNPKKWRGQFRVLQRGQPLLFKLKSPANAIVGGGFFEHYSDLPISLAWQAFGEKNGAPSLEAFQQGTSRLRKDRPRLWEDYTIGCILLAAPFFWAETDWIPQPEDWSRSIQRGKGYDLQTGIGKRLWTQVSDRLLGTIVPDRPQDGWGGYGNPVSVRPRVGQGIFRTAVADAYGRQCAVTREKTFPALEAAHIRPFKEDPKHYVRNGLLLRSDIHKLFDAGYVTVSPDYQFEVSDHIYADFNNGKHYYKLHGKKLWIPESPEKQPDREHLEWHNENRYRG